MNTTKKLLLATLILGIGTQNVTAHPWSAKALAAATVAGLGLGYGAVKYYGFNTLTNAALEKCAHGKNWIFTTVSNKFSDYFYGSYKNKIQSLEKSRTELIEKSHAEQADLKAENARLKKVAEQAARAQERHARNVQFSAHTRSKELSRDLQNAQQKLHELKADAVQMRYDVIMELKQFHDQLSHLINVAPAMSQEYLEEKVDNTCQPAA